MTETRKSRLAFSAGLIFLAVALAASSLILLNPLQVFASETAEGFAVSEAQVKQYQSEDVNGGSIRFVVNVSDEIYSTYDPAGDWTYGTLIIPTYMLGSSELTFDTEDVLDIPASNWLDPEEDHAYTAVLKGQSGSEVISSSFFNTPFSARGYITDGETVIYTDEALSRSIGYVATMNVANGSDHEILKNIASSTEKSITLEKTRLVGTADTIVPSVVFGKISVPESQLSILDISYAITGKGVAEGENNALVANGYGTSAVTATLAIPGLESVVISDVTVRSYDTVSLSLTVGDDGAISGDGITAQTVTLPTSRVWTLNDAQTVTVDMTASNKLAEELIINGVTVGSTETMVKIGGVHYLVGHANLTVAGQVSFKIAYIQDRFYYAEANVNIKNLTGEAGSYAVGTDSKQLTEKTDSKITTVEGVTAYHTNLQKSSEVWCNNWRLTLNKSGMDSISFYLTFNYAGGTTFKTRMPPTRPSWIILSALAISISRNGAMKTEGSHSGLPLMLLSLLQA